MEINTLKYAPPHVGSASFLGRYSSLINIDLHHLEKMSNERPVGIEPTPRAWEAASEKITLSTYFS